MCSIHKKNTVKLCFARSFTLERARASLCRNSGEGEQAHILCMSRLGLQHFSIRLAFTRKILSSLHFKACFVLQRSSSGNLNVMRPVPTEIENEFYRVIPQAEICPGRSKRAPQKQVRIRRKTGPYIFSMAPHICFRLLRKNMPMCGLQIRVCDSRMASGGSCAFRHRLCTEPQQLNTYIYLVTGKHQLKRVV